MSWHSKIHATFQAANTLQWRNVLGARFAGQVATDSTALNTVGFIKTEKLKQTIKLCSHALNANIESSEVISSVS